MKPAYFVLCAVIAGSLALLSYLNTCSWWAALIIFALVGVLLSVQRNLIVASIMDRVQALKTQSLGLHRMQLEKTVQQSVRILELEAELETLKCASGQCASGQCGEPCGESA
jgi:membrane protein implicated in regulation of membrane protease activity